MATFRRPTVPAAAVLGVMAVMLATPTHRVARAHAGHGGVAPTFKEVRAGAETWRVGFGVSPADPVAGEAVRIEVRAVPLEAGGEGSPATRDQVRLSIDDDVVPLGASNATGVLGAHVRVDEPGSRRVQIVVRGTTSEFPLRVQPGPAARLRQVVALAAVLMLAIVGALLARSLRARWSAGGAQRAGLAIVALVLLVGAWMASGLVAGVLAREFLPDRSQVEIDWIPEAETSTEASPTDEAPANGQTRDVASAAARLAADGITARVVAAPGAIAEIIVPMPGRIVATEGPRVTLGSRVRKGQELTRLQPSYIMHDALHLINQRWPILQGMVDSKREMLNAEAAAARLKLAVADKAASTMALQEAETAAVATKAEYERWARTLRMHDVQIADDQPSRVPILSPIDGEVAAANFAQGQLVYEGDQLFTIVDLHTVWIEARVPETLVAGFRETSVTFQSPTFADATFRGALQRVAPAVEPQSRTLSHFYAVPNPDRRLKVGMVLRASGRSTTRPDVS